MEEPQNFSSDETIIVVVPTEPELPKEVELDTVETNNESN